MPQPTTRARQTRHPGYSETLPRQPESATTARRLLRTACAVWGLDDLAEDGALIVSELVANAVRHARRESVRVVIDRPDAARVRVGVADLSVINGETPGRSAARAHLPQLIGLFGTDGCLRISTAPTEPCPPAFGGEPEDDEQH